METLLSGSFSTFVDLQPWAGTEDSAVEIDAIELVAVPLVLQTPVLVIVAVTVGRAAVLLVLFVCSSSSNSATY